MKLPEWITNFEVIVKDTDVENVDDEIQSHTIRLAIKVFSKRNDQVGNNENVHKWGIRLFLVVSTVKEIQI